MFQTKSHDFFFDLANLRLQPELRVLHGTGILSAGLLLGW